jgi:competence protein ComEA
VSLSTDHKALLFLGAIAVLGAGVRIVRWSKGTDVVAEQTALDRQLGAADSAAHASRRPKARGRNARARPTTARTSRAEPAASPAMQVPPGLSAPGYVSGKLDVDAATMAQIDSLPGIGPTLAKRIVADRAEHGPFVTLQGLRRVKGVGPALLRRLDTLVTFSATLRPLSAAPESVSARPSRRVKR